MTRIIKKLVGRLSFAKTVCGKYLVRRFFDVTKGRTRLNMLEAFPAFAANGWGFYEPRARLTVKAINQTVPAFLLLPVRELQSPLHVSTIEAFGSGDEVPRDAARLKFLFDSSGSDKARTHDYYLAYVRMLADPQRVSKVFEIGLGTNNEDVVSTMGSRGRPGASLRAFRTYCPVAKVYGADFDRRILFEEDRIQTFFIDQTNVGTFQAVGEAIGGEFDLMIDDGLHAPNANLHSLAFFLPRIRIGGWAVIEDISPASESIWEVVSRILPARYECFLLRGAAAVMFAVRRRE